MAYLPESIWLMPSGNVVNLYHASVLRCGERSEWWEVQEFDGYSALVQRRKYETQAEAESWIEEFGGTLTAQN